MRVHRKSAGGEAEKMCSVPGKFRPGLKREERETDKIEAGCTTSRRKRLAHVLLVL